MSDAPDRERQILYLVDELDGAHGGTEGQLQLLLGNLPDGWRASLWVLRAANDLADAAFPVPIRRLGIGSLKSPLTIRRLRKLATEVQDLGIDLIHSFLADTCLVAPILGHYAGVPAVTSRRDLGYWQTARIIEALRRVNRLATAIVANAEVVGRRTVTIEHALPSQVHVIANGHPGARFEAPADPDLRTRLGIPTEARIVGLLANFRPLKRVEDLIQALAQLADDAADVHVLLIGTGPEGADHLRLAESLGLQGRVHVHGVIGDVVPVLKLLTIGVLCSESEGLSNALIEYMACGLPVIASDVGGNPEVVSDESTGLLYPAGDIPRLTAALRSLLLDPDRAACLGAAGRARFEERYLLDRMVADTLTCYRSALVQHAARPPSSLNWRVVTEVDELERLAPAWEALLEDGQFFSGPVWTLAWLRTQGARPCVPVAEDTDGALVGLLPLVWSDRRTLIGCGQGEGADHLDVVAAAGREQEVARGVLPALEREPWSRIDLRHVSEDAMLRRALREPACVYPSGERYATLCPYVQPGTDWDAFLARRMSSRSRKKFRRLTRRFFERDGARVRRVQAPQDATAAVDQILALHARRFADRDVATTFAGTAVRAFHHALAGRLAEEGRFCLLFLEAEGKTAAAIYTFTQGKRLYYFQTGLDPAFGQASPGLVLQGRLLEEDVLGAGLEECDFLDGDEAYKLSWSTGVRRLFDITIRRNSRRGRWTAALGGLDALARSEGKRALAFLRRSDDA